MDMTFFRFDFIMLVHFPSKGVEVDNFRKVQRGILRSGPSFTHYLWFVNQKCSSLNWLKIAEGKTNGKHSDTFEDICKGCSRGLLIKITKIAAVYPTPATCLAAWGSYPTCFLILWHQLGVQQFSSLPGVSVWSHKFGPTRLPPLQRAASRPGPPILLTNGYKFGGSHNCPFKFSNLLEWLTKLESV